MYMHMHRIYSYHGASYTGLRMKAVALEYPTLLNLNLKFLLQNLKFFIVTPQKGKRRLANSLFLSHYMPIIQIRMMQFHVINNLDTPSFTEN